MERIIVERWRKMNGLFIPILINVAGFGLVLWVLYCINHHIPQKRLDVLFEKTNPSADVRSIGMIRQSIFEGPGVAQVLNGELYVYTFGGIVFQIPLAQVKVKKIRRNNIFGGSGWWRKTIFYLDTPQTSGLQIGVKPEDSAPWERILKLTE